APPFRHLWRPVWRQREKRASLVAVPISIRIGERAMTHIDVEELRDFYATPLGQMVRRGLARRIRQRWASVKGATLLGLGYAAPYLGSFRGEAGRIGALM